MRLLVISGPTASGKSILAEYAADLLDGVIINADSQQFFSDVPILSAQPSPLIPGRHFLYSTGLDTVSVHTWLTLVNDIIGTLGNKVVIVVGGSGFYIKALTRGLTLSSPPSAKVREEVACMSTSEIYASLNSLSPDHGIHPNHRSRLARRLEIALSPEITSTHIKPLPCMHITLMPERNTLYAACGHRFDQMVSSGAVEEVRLAVRPSSAIGFAELRDFINGRSSLELARLIATQKTRNYAKRQLTWFAHQAPEAIRVSSISEALNVIKITPNVGAN